MHTSLQRLPEPIADLKAREEAVLGHWQRAHGLHPGLSGLSQIQKVLTAHDDKAYHVKLVVW